ncbi:MAG: SCO family protein [Candidatus Thiodiazotropha sp. (ex Notomyrtea botanica)]|nr:SCO family protein [Candidatus Thiodiazotropha sp. (ex Notomyrtea botanica)]
MNETQKPLKQNSRKSILILILLIPLLIAGVSSWFLFNTQPPTVKAHIETKGATLLPQLRPLAAFSLNDHQGKTFDNSRLLGRWTLLSFGYTHCPDICPSTLAMLAEINLNLQQTERKFPYQIGFVSVDPERDTTERLAEYVTYFDPSFLGIRGDDAALQTVTKPLGILYRKVETEKSAMGYVMDHSASIILVDPQGRYHALFSPPHDPAIMADDLLTITRQVD